MPMKGHKAPKGSTISKIIKTNLICTFLLTFCTRKQQKQQKLMKIQHSIMQLNPMTPNILKMVKHTLNAFPFEEAYFFHLTSYFEF